MGAVLSVDPATSVDEGMGAVLSVDPATSEDKGMTDDVLKRGSGKWRGNSRGDWQGAVGRWAVLVARWPCREGGDDGLRSSWASMLWLPRVGLCPGGDARRGE